MDINTNFLNIGDFSFELLAAAAGGIDFCQRNMRLIFYPKHMSDMVH
ncbi:hypothetical protein [Snodgrassella sp. ESL0253]|nr:hypothetical protein [Snodgrassella sp. ESL0253]NUE66650.1 hypothetical protein [Snodgrassella sp. ESL0253]